MIQVWTIEMLLFGLFVFSPKLFFESLLCLIYPSKINGSSSAVHPATAQGQRLPKQARYVKKGSGDKRLSDDGAVVT